MNFRGSRKVKIVVKFFHKKYSQWPISKFFEMLVSNEMRCPFHPNDEAVFVGKSEMADY